MNVRASSAGELLSFSWPGVVVKVRVTMNTATTVNVRASSSARERSTLATSGAPTYSSKLRSFLISWAAVFNSRCPSNCDGTHFQVASDLGGQFCLRAKYLGAALLRITGPRRPEPGISRALTLITILTLPRIRGGGSGWGCVRHVFVLSPDLLRDENQVPETRIIVDL